MRMQSQANLVPTILMRYKPSDEAAAFFRYASTTELLGSLECKVDFR